MPASQRDLMYCRPFCRNDLSAICALPATEQDLFFMFPKATYPLTEEELVASVESRSDSTVILHQGRIVGFANFVRWEQGGRCAIGNVIIDKNCRRAGIGRALVLEMIRIAREKHRASEITLGCFNHNIGGLLFYSRLGFEPFALEERVDKSGNPVALIYMRYRR